MAPDCPPTLAEKPGPARPSTLGQPFPVDANEYPQVFDLTREHHSTLVMVTHDQALAAHCGRQISLSASRMLKSPVCAQSRA